MAIQDDLRMLGLLNDPNIDSVDNKDITKGMTDAQKQQAMGFINKEEPSLVDTVVEKAKAIPTNLLGEKTVEKKVNTPQPTPKKASKTSQDPSGRSEYVTLDTPEKVAQVASETQGEIVEAADDKSMWESALEQLGYGVDVAKKVWDEIPSTGDRVDWLTTLTVYAASRYMGNNGGLALANGLMRGMESQAKKNQLKRAMEQGQAQAEAAAVQQGIENRFKDREISAKEKTAEASLLTAQNRGTDTEPTKALSSDEVNMLTATADSMGLNAEAANAVGSYIKDKKLPFTQINIRKVANAMKEKGLLSNNFFRDDTLLAE